MSAVIGYLQQRPTYLEVGSRVVLVSDCGGLRPPLFLSTMSDDGELKWLGLRHEANEIRLAEIFSSLTDNGFEPLLIKGYAAAIHYPRVHLRSYSDIDVCVDPSAYPRAKAFLRSRKFGFGIDLHSGLRHLHPSHFRDVLGRAQALSIRCVGVKVPSPEDHLIILATHWLNDGGAKRDRLADLKHIVEGQPNLDWDLIRRILPRHRLRWLQIALGAATEYGGLDSKKAACSPEELRIPKWVDRALHSGWHGPELEPLYYRNDSVRGILRQLRMRFPPNPIESTVECDGDFDSGIIWTYQLRALLKRVPKGIWMQIKTLLAGRLPE